MSVTYRTDGPSVGATGPLPRDPALTKQLWLLWAKQTDAIAKRLRVDSLDDEWLEGVGVLSEAAADIGAAKVGAVARKAEAMTTGALENRALAIKAFRVAARLDYKKAAAFD